MLTDLRINNFILIDRLDVSFQPGLNALLGETGAGKSIIVNAVLLLTGARSSFDKLQDENRKAVIEATFELRPSFVADHPYLKDYIEGSTLTVSRSLLPSRTSVFRVNGEQVSAAEARRVMEDVIDISSQGSQSFIARRANQITVLDRSVKDPAYQADLAAFRGLYQTYLDAVREREEFVARSRESDLDLIRFRLAEIADRRIEEDEIERLKSELQTAENLEDLRAGGQRLLELYNSELYSSFGEELTSGLAGIASGDLADQARTVSESWSQFAGEFGALVGAFGSLDIDAERIDELNQRLYDLKPLIKRYGESTAAILAVQRSLEERLAEADSYDERLHNLELEVESARVKALKAAEALSADRRRWAEQISADVNREFADLGLRADGFKIEVAAGELGTNGLDEVTFLVGLNKGHPFESVEAAASGGETSRLMIALKKVFNEAYPADTLVLDEVDSGVSGEIALKVGRKIRQLAAASSVLAISHLPAVVAAADSWYLVSKKDEGERTVSTISPLEKKAALPEIARMLGGNRLDEDSLRLAANLMEEQHR